MDTSTSKQYNIKQRKMWKIGKCEKRILILNVLTAAAATFTAAATE